MRKLWLCGPFLNKHEGSLLTLEIADWQKINEKALEILIRSSPPIEIAQFPRTPRHVGEIWNQFPEVELGTNVLMQLLIACDHQTFSFSWFFSDDKMKFEKTQGGVFFRWSWSPNICLPAWTLTLSFSVLLMHSPFSLSMPVCLCSIYSIFVIVKRLKSTISNVSWIHSSFLQKENSQSL